jgi:hypothetical protein
VLLFVVARTRLGYEELRRDFEDWRDVRIILDRREGERRVSHDAFSARLVGHEPAQRRGEVDASWCEAREGQSKAKASCCAHVAEQRRLQG